MALSILPESWLPRTKMYGASMSSMRSTSCASGVGTPIADVTRVHDDVDLEVSGELRDEVIALRVVVEVADVEEPDGVIAGVEGGQVLGRVGRS